MIFKLKSPKLIYLHQTSLNFKSALPTAGLTSPLGYLSQIQSHVENGLVLFPWKPVDLTPRVGPSHHWASPHTQFHMPGNLGAIPLPSSPLASTFQPTRNSCLFYLNVTNLKSTLSSFFSSESPKTSIITSHLHYYYRASYYDLSSFGGGTLFIITIYTKQVCKTYLLTYTFFITTLIPF